MLPAGYSRRYYYFNKKNTKFFVQQMKGEIKLKQ